MSNKTIELAKGVSVTLAPADGWAIMFRGAIMAHFNSFRDSPIESDKTALGSFLFSYALCIPQIQSVEGMDWQPPDIWASVDILRADFEAWYKALPDNKSESTILIMDTITELNNPTVADELAPGGAPEKGSPKARKDSKTA